ncbi:MAG: DUF2975 domain-containing protein [Clostridiales bacterium]|nr:DUF2975 domain-containing protein [Clostridiales bacterium]
MGYNNGIIRWTKIATIMFIGITLVGDIFGIVITKYIALVWAGITEVEKFAALAVVFYLGTAGAYVVLFSLLKLLSNMSKDKVFDRQNTKLMAIITAALVGIAVDCTVGGFIWFGCWELTILALFMGLVVMSVKVVFDKAITMKEEMDLTI